MTKLVVLMVLAALSAPAKEWVMVKHGDRAVQTFVVYREVKEKAPVVRRMPAKRMPTPETTRG